MNPEAMLLAADVPGWLLNVRDWWMLNWLWVVRALVEIAVLAVVIYYAFQYLKRTRGWPVVAGFLALLALTLVTELLKLQVLSWLLAAVFTFLVLAILIIFQPELRRLLAGLGSLPIFNAGEEQEQENIGMVIEVARRLARDHIGALIVIERAVVGAFVLGKFQHDVHRCRAAQGLVDELQALVNLRVFVEIRNEAVLDLQSVYACGARGADDDGKHEYE